MFMSWNLGLLVFGKSVTKELFTLGIDFKPEEIETVFVMQIFPMKRFQTTPRSMLLGS